MKTYNELMEDRKAVFVAYVESGRCFTDDGTTLKGLGTMAREALGSSMLARRCATWLADRFPELAKTRSVAAHAKAKRAQNEAKAVEALALAEVEQGLESERIAQAHPITYGDLQVALAKVKGATTDALPSMVIPLIPEPEADTPTE